MTTPIKAQVRGSFDLSGLTAQDVMTANPISLRADATDAEVMRALTDKGITAAVVIDDAGHPLGVVSATDVLIHQRAKLGSEAKGIVTVRDMMTPAVFSARLDAPARQLVEQMVAMNIHHLFVIDASQTIVGVVSALDILRAMV